DGAGPPPRRWGVPPCRRAPHRGQRRHRLRGRAGVRADPAGPGREPQQDVGGVRPRVRRHRAVRRGDRRPDPPLHRQAGAGARPGDRRGGPARRPGRVDDQARPRREGHGRGAPRARRARRPVRRHAVRPAGDVLPAPVHEGGLTPRRRGRPLGWDHGGMATTLALVGSTGSIGTQAVDVVRATPGRFDVVAIGAATSVDRLAAQAEELRPRVVAIADEGLAPALKARVPAGTEVRAGADALASLAPLADVVLNAVVGFAGLPVTLAALAAGRRLALANKESLIAGAPAVAAVRATPGAEVVPVDSEHCAIHQCLRTGQPEAELARLVLTASGGPFRGRTRDELTAVTVGDALAHPTWSMGPKITIDSSTLMNKGLEVLEAHELFDVGLDRVEVIIHPQSVVHSFVEWSDGATIAQLSQPDMRLPIGYALSYPSRLPVAFGPLDWAGLGALTFEPPDLEAFSCL